MSYVDHLPFGAETPDEFLSAYANGTLSPPERAEVDRWLAAHPEWVGRLRAYQAIGTAVRQSAAASQPPNIRSMHNLWAAFDATPQPRPLRPAAPPPPPTPPAYVTAPPGGGFGSRTATRILAVAATLVVAVVAVSAVVLLTRDDGELSIREGVEATEPANEGDGAGSPPAGSGSANAAQALRDGAAETAEQDTAHTTFEATADVDLSGTDLADITNTETAVITITGTGAVKFPDESVLDTTTTFTGGFFEILPDEHVSSVTKGEETYVSCEGGPYVLDGEDAESQCTSLTFGTAFFGPDAGVTLLDRANDDVTEIGIEDIEGGPATHYRLVIDIPDDEGGADPATFDVWIGVDDGLIHQVTVTVDFTLPLELGDETYELPMALTMTYRLGQFGEPVEIPEVG